MITITQNKNRIKTCFFCFVPFRYRQNTHGLSQADLLETVRRTKFSVKVGDTSERPNPWTGATPVAVSTVLARSQVVGPPPVVGLVIQQPVAIDHIA